MAREWNYVEKVGNPTEAGLYWVTLIYPEVERIMGTFCDFKETGKVFAEVCTRYFGDADNADGYIMADQPDTGLVWYEETGSHMYEKVHAWSPIEGIDIADLPDGVEVKE